MIKPDKRMAVLPSPKSTLPILGNTLDFMVFQLPRIYDWITDECARHQGRPWRLQLIGQPPTVVLSSVETFEDVMKTQFDVFEKGEIVCEVFRDPGGNGIFSADGDAWKAQRKVLAHLFTLQAFRETIADTIIANVRVLGRVLDNKMQNQEPVDFSQLCHRFTYDTFVKVGFGMDSNTLTGEQSDEISQALDAIIVGVQMRIMRPMLMWKLERWLGLGAQGRMMKQIKVFDKVAYGIVNECLRRKSAAETLNVSNKVPPRKVNDIVSLFMDEYAQSSSADQVLKIDAAFLRDTGVSMLLAGRDTTALALVWCNLMLNKHREIAERICQELRSVVPRLFEDREFVPEMDQVDQLLYMEAFVRETLRLYPHSTPVRPIATRHFQMERLSPKDPRYCSQPMLWGAWRPSGEKTHGSLNRSDGLRLTSRRTSRRFERSRPFKTLSSMAALASALVCASPCWNSRLRWPMC